MPENPQSLDTSDTFPKITSDVDSLNQRKDLVVMYVRSITLENFKSFREKTTISFCPEVNYLVGNNNSGKSSLIEAMLFLFEGPSSKLPPESIYSRDTNGPTRVELDIAGDIDELVSHEKFKLLRDFVFDHEGERVLRMKRSSEERTVSQNGKLKTIGPKAICFWNPKTETFENVTGIDARAKAILDFETVWADTHPDDHINFAANKTLGRLLSTAFERFKDSAQWNELLKAHNNAFAPEDTESFYTEAKQISEAIKEIVDAQFGSASYRFDFDPPEASVFMKEGCLYVDDGAGEAPVENMGTGMQRAIALALIQVYARQVELSETPSDQRLIFVLDEPETWLHPKAQLQLGQDLGRIGDHDQVFVITHSPFLIRNFQSGEHSLIVFDEPDSSRRITCSTELGIIDQGRPSWAEINYQAFGICSVDFHNELYGCIGRYLQSQTGKTARIGDVDDFLETKKIPRDQCWIRTDRRQQDVTLHSYIRNAIHHPENRLNKEFTPEQLRKSTRSLVEIAKSLPNTHGDNVDLLEYNADLSKGKHDEPAASLNH